MSELNNRLPKSYFKAHPLENLSFARFSFFQMAELKLGVASEVFFDAQNCMLLSQERKDQIAAENERIMKLQTAEAIVDALRKEREILCRDTIVRRALELEDEVLPLLLKRYRTNSMDFFIESAAQIFAHADRKYSEILFADYSLIRAAYARAQACLVFAAQDMTQAIPLLVQEVERLGQVKNQENKSDLSQAPLLALYVLNDQSY